MGLRGPQPKPAWQRQGHRRRPEARQALDRRLAEFIEDDEHDDEPDESPVAGIIKSYGRH